MKLRLSYILLIAAFVLAIATDVFFYLANGFGINMPLMELLFLGVSIWLAKSQKVAITKPAKIAAGFALAFSGTFAIWASDVSTALCFLGFLISNMLFVAFMLGESASFRHPLEVMHHLVIVPLKHGMFALPFVRTLMPEKASPRTRSIIKAVIIALPILFIFTLTFVAADAVFKSYITDALNSISAWMNIDTVVGHVFFVGVFVVLFGLFFAAAFSDRKSIARTIEDSPARAVLESKIILGSVVALFAFFLAVSGAALFGGETALQGLDISYSEYARQGFGQLCAAAALVIGLIMTLRVLHTEAVDKKLLGLHIALIVEAGLVLVSAFMRLGMYIAAYGYSPARLFGLWFFGLIAVFLVLTLVNVIKHNKQTRLMSQMLIGGSSAILLFTLTGPDTLATELNSNRTDIEVEAWQTPSSQNDVWQSWNYTRSIEQAIEKTSY